MNAPGTKHSAPRTNPCTDLPDDVVLSVRGVSKKFCRNLKRSMLYGMQDLARNMLGMRPGTNALQHAGEIGTPLLRHSEFWAVQNISFELKRGETLGLIGLNGCGKTTLLRILSGVFPPDQGVVTIRGRMGGLIALGAGFHPHMTGRENIYLNGAILGIRKDELDEQLEEIIAFADIGEFIDAPVSTYSSGMHVRLGFAIATATEPDLLLLDEVLAVGDVAFRAKCYTRVANLRERAAVILVSHSMEQITRVCNKVVLMDKGQCIYYGDPARAVELYLERGYNAGHENEGFETVQLPLLSGSSEIDSLEITYGGLLGCTLKWVAEKPIPDAHARILFFDWGGQIVGEWDSRHMHIQFDINEGPGKVYIEIGPVLLKSGAYQLVVGISDAGGVKPLYWSFKVHRIKITGQAGGHAPYIMAGDMKA